MPQEFCSRSFCNNQLNCCSGLSARVLPCARFIPIGIMDYFRSQFWPRATNGDDARRKAAAPIDVCATMRRMWR